MIAKNNKKHPEGGEKQVSEWNTEQPEYTKLEDHVPPNPNKASTNRMR